MLIGLAQLRPVRGNPAANLHIAAQACAQARGQGADLIVFPELWQTGYSPYPSARAEQESWMSAAQTSEDPWVTAFREIARTERLAVITTFLRRTETGLRSSAAVIDVAGEIALVHDKVHVCDFNWEQVLEAGTAFDSAPVPLRNDVVRVGVMTCFDREFPESARELALAGAELIVSPNACLLCDDRLGQLRCRAFENMVAVALANYPMPLMNGRSCVFDGVAVANGRPRDHRILAAEAKAGIFQADVDLDALRSYRADGVWKLSRRRAGAYRRLGGSSAEGENYGT